MDLIAILATSLALVPAVMLTTGPLRIALGLAFVLFFPGYTLIAALFPKKGSLGGIERLALSFGLSIAVVPLIGLVLNYTPWGIRLYPILVSLMAFILAMCGVAWYRRRGLTENERFTVSFKIVLNLIQDPSLRGQSKVDRVLSLVLVLVIVGAIGTLVSVIATPKVGERFTEFYILGPQGKAEYYPGVLMVGQEGKVILGIVNHEQEEMSYRVEVEIGGEKVKLKVGDEERDTVEVELAPEEKWEREVGFVPQKVGKEQKVEFLLYKGVITEPYLKLHLWVDVE